MVPVRPGGQIKTDRRDATTLAALFRAGELTAIWVPDAAHEAMRDLSRARHGHGGVAPSAATTSCLSSCGTDAFMQPGAVGRVLTAGPGWG